MFYTKVITPPASELLLLADVKLHLAVTHTDDDTYLTDLITQVRAAVESWCGISIGSQTRQWIYDFNGCEWQVPYGPVIAITTVERKVAAGDYDAVTLNNDFDFEGDKLHLYSPGRYKVTYTAGYTALPHDLKRGMLEEITYRYEHKGDVQPGLSELSRSYLIRFKDFTWD